MKTFISSLIFAFFCVSLVAQTPVNLKLNLEKGKVYTIKETSKQKIQQTANGQQFAIDVISNNVISCKVLQKGNDMMDIEFKFDTIASKVSSPMFNMETNSTKPGIEPLEKIMNKMSTYKLVAKISTTGKFIDFVNFANYKDSIMFVMDSIPASKRDNARKQADALLKESAVKSMIEPIFAFLPDKAIKTGDNWETSYISVSGDMSLLMVNSITLKDIKDNQVKLSGTTEMESMPSNDPNAQMRQELKGTSTFESTVDLQTGLFLKSNSKGHFEGATIMKNNGEEMNMPMKVDSEVETVITK